MEISSQDGVRGGVLNMVISSKDGCGTCGRGLRIFITSSRLNLSRFFSWAWFAS